MEKHKEYPYNLPLDDKCCQICGKETEFNEEWTTEDAVEDYELQMIDANLNNPDPSDEAKKFNDGKPGVACGTCYNMLYHYIAPSKVFLKGMLKLGVINKKQYRLVKKSYGL